MAKPIILPFWDTTEVNSTVPDATHQQQGWIAPGGIPEKPPFQTFNHWQNNVYKWINEINIKGVLGYDALTDYLADDSYAAGSDGEIYHCLINNGPSSSIVDPVGDVTGTWKKFSAIESTSKVWFYQDTAPDGWTIDSTPSDSLLAVKGGSTYTTGGTQAGTWTQPDHALTESEMPSHTHALTNGTQVWRNEGGANTMAGGGSSTTATLTAGATGSDTAHNHGSAYRPTAEVGIICSKD